MKEVWIYSLHRQGENLRKKFSVACCKFMNFVLRIELNLKENPCFPYNRSLPWDSDLPRGRRGRPPGIPIHCFESAAFCPHLN